MNRFFPYIYIVFGFFLAPLWAVNTSYQGEGVPYSIEVAGEERKKEGEGAIALPPGAGKPYNGVKQKKLLTDDEREDIEAERRQKIREKDAERKKKREDMREAKKDKIEEFDGEVDKVFESSLEARTKAVALKKIHARILNNPPTRNQLLKDIEKIKDIEDDIRLFPDFFEKQKAAAQCTARVKVLLEEAVAFTGEEEEPKEEKKIELDLVEDHIRAKQPPPPPAKTPPIKEDPRSSFEKDADAAFGNSQALIDIKYRQNLKEAYKNLTEKKATWIIKNDQKKIKEMETHIDMFPTFPKDTQAYKRCISLIKSGFEEVLPKEEKPIEKKPYNKYIAPKKNTSNLFSQNFEQPFINPAPVNNNTQNKEIQQIKKEIRSLKDSKKEKNTPGVYDINMWRKNDTPNFFNKNKKDDAYNFEKEVDVAFGNIWKLKKHKKTLKEVHKSLKRRGLAEYLILIKAQKVRDLEKEIDMFPSRLKDSQAYARCIAHIKNMLTEALPGNKYLKKKKKIDFSKEKVCIRNTTTSSSRSRSSRREETIATTQTDTPTTTITPPPSEDNTPEIESPQKKEKNNTEEGWSKYEIIFAVSASSVIVVFFSVVLWNIFSSKSKATKSP